jgi:hypothetical protein
MVFAMGFATKSSCAGHVPDESDRVRRVAVRRNEFLRTPASSGRAGVRARRTRSGPYARTQYRNEERDAVRASAPESSGATRSRRWFSRPRRLSSRLLSSGRSPFPEILQRRTPGAPPRACSHRSTQGASRGSLAIKGSSSSVCSEESRRQVRSVPAHRATKAESRLRRGSGKRSHS